MLNLHQKSIRMNRLELLEALRKNLEAFTVEYNDALVDYQILITNRLHEAFLLARDSTPEAAAKIVVKFTPPPDHRADYVDAIEMLERSADDLIEINQPSFKAYVMNEWEWTRSFKELSAANKSDPHATIGASLR